MFYFKLAILPYLHLFVFLSEKYTTNAAATKKATTQMINKAGDKNSPLVQNRFVITFSFKLCLKYNINN